jgi:hypothetical protein
LRLHGNRSITPEFSIEIPIDLIICPQRRHPSEICTTRSTCQARHTSAPLTRSLAVLRPSFIATITSHSCGQSMPLINNADARSAARDCSTLYSSHSCGGLYSRLVTPDLDDITCLLPTRHIHHDVIVVTHAQNDMRRKHDGLAVLKHAQC